MGHLEQNIHSVFSLFVCLFVCVFKASTLKSSPLKKKIIRDLFIPSRSLSQGFDQSPLNSWLAAMT